MGNGTAGAFEEGGEQMAFQMIDGDEGLACRQSKSLGRAVAYQERSYQAGATRGAENVNVRRSCSGFAARGTDDSGKVR